MDTEDLPTSGANIQCLPDEILMKILTDLSLSDRKNTRAVSKRWLRLNNDKEISKRERLYFNGHFDLNAGVILEILENSQRSILNLQLLHLNFIIEPTRSLLLWKNCGSRIRSFSLESCKLSNQTLQHVIEYCDEMQDLAFYYCASVLSKSSIVYIIDYSTGHLYRKLKRVKKVKHR